MSNNNYQAEEDTGGGGDGDEYGEFEGAQVEDDAPESVQALGGGGQPAWAAFPDLVRVPNNANNSNSSSSACIEDDPPESQLSFSQRVRSSINANHNAAEAVHPNCLPGQNTGAIPKASSRQSVAPPPDVSLAGPSQASSSGARVPNSLSGNDLLSMTGATSSRSGRNNLEQDIVSLRTQNAVLHQQINQKDNKIRDLEESGPSQLTPATSQVLLNVAASVASLQSSFEAMATEVTQRLNRLETRLNSLVVSDNQSVSVDATGAIREELRALRAQQTRDIQDDRQTYLLALSDALRAASNATGFKNRNPDVNGPEK